MTSEQIKHIKDICLTDDGTGKPKAGVFTVLFNDEISFRNTDDFVVWDDENELIHKITVNFDGPVSGAMWPYKISTGFFGNIQFLEGLYDMGNFEKVVDEMFVSTGLIDDKKKETIMKWASNIRNHAMVPKAPGPYYTSTAQIPPKPPVPEVRPDGIFHADPIDQRTKQNMIYKIVDPLIVDDDDSSFKKIAPTVYEVSAFDMTKFAEKVKSLIESLGSDLFYASYTNNEDAAIYDPNYQAFVERFVEASVKCVLPKKKKTSTKTILYIEAYGVRVKYTFNVLYANDDAGDAEWIINTSKSILNFVENIDSSAIDSLVANSPYNFSAVINSTNDLDIGLTDFLSSLPNTSRVIYSANGRSYTMIIGDDSTYNTFKEGVINSMPDSNNAETVTGVASVISDNNVELQYTLKVKYFNESEAVAKIGTKYFSILGNAFTAAKSGDTIELLKNVDVTNNGISGTSDSGVLVIPDGVTFDGGSHTITANPDGWVDMGGMYGNNHILAVGGTTATIRNVNLIGHANMKSGILAWKGANVTIDTVDVKNCGNCGVQAAGATVSLTNYTSDGNTWGSINADMGDGVTPMVTFNSGSMSEIVEIYTEITDKDVVSAPTLTKYQGFGANLKGFVYYTSDVTKFTNSGAVVYEGAIYESINDIMTNNETVTLSIENNMTQNIVVPEGKTLNLDLNGHNITNVGDSDTMVNNGTMVISGNGTIDNTVHGKAAVNNNGNMTILGGTISRSNDAGTADGANGNSYYTLVNHGNMVIGSEDGDNSGISITSAGSYSSLVENGWYDSNGKTPENDTCTLTIHGANFIGGKYNVKNDELGDVTINGGSFTGASDVALLNWHNMYINGGVFDGTGNDNSILSNGTYGQGVGHAEITNGDFTAGSGRACIVETASYQSSDVTVSGGVFNTDANLATYVASGYTIDSEINPGKFTVVKDSSSTVDEDIKSFIEGLDAEGVTVEADPELPNTYTIVTDGSVNINGLIDQVTSLDGVNTVRVSDNETTAEYTIGGDLESFKNQVAAMLPTLNEDDEVTLTMTVIAG